MKVHRAAPSALSAAHPAFSAMKVHRKTRRFCTRHSTAVCQPDDVECTDFIGLGQCKKQNGPHGRGMALLASCVDSVSDRPDRHVKTLRSRRNRGRKDRRIAKKRPQPQVPDRSHKVQDPPPDGSFPYVDWGNEDSRIFAASLQTGRDANIVPIGDWRVVDNFGTEGRQNEGRGNSLHHVHYDVNGKFLFAKVSQRQCATHIGGYDRCKDVSELFAAHGFWRPKVARGRVRGADGAKYSIHGIRKDPLGKGLSTYEWKKNADEETRKKIVDDMAKLELKLEWCTRAIDGGFIESTVAAEAVEVLDLPTPSLKSRRSSEKTDRVPPHRYGTAMSVGENYWSPFHVDPDFYFTAVVFIGPTSLPKDRFNEIIGYFCFPEYKIKVPMRSGEVLVFNPSVSHACSNPKFRKSFVSSNFCPVKTVRVQASQQFQT